MRALIGVVVGLLEVPAHADIVVQPGVPFTASQLEAALAARGGPLDVDVEVSSSGPDQLKLRTLAGEWEIDIGAASGETAARVVALHVVELVEHASPVPAIAVGVIAAALAAAPAAELRAPSLAPREGHRYRLGVLGIGSRGSRANDFATLGGAVELLRGDRWLVGGGVAWQRGLTIDRWPGAPIAAELVRLRGVGGVALGRAELVLGGFAGLLTVEGGSLRIRRWAVGLAAEARVAMPVTVAWSVVFAASAEVFRHRIEVEFDYVQLGATPRATLGGGIGLAWTPGPPP